MRFRQKPASKAGPFPLLDSRPKRCRKEMLLVAPNPTTGRKETAPGWRLQMPACAPASLFPFSLAQRNDSFQENCAPTPATTKRKKKERMGRERKEKEGKKEKKKVRRGERERMKEGRKERKRQKES